MLPETPKYTIEDTQRYALSLRKAKQLSKLPSFPIETARLITGRPSFNYMSNTPRPSSSSSPLNDRSSNLNDTMPVAPPPSPIINPILTMDCGVKMQKWDKGGTCHPADHRKRGCGGCRYWRVIDDFEGLKTCKYCRARARERSRRGKKVAHQ
ncbi:hypothetical protein VKT23_004090 [Stygiomarasmius scandens]|uniref:GATA-type domain-containing protein n=1 Tax=Marasmiellus scandens TaxID=2682957 RepID=A0ABR1JXQ7_9AGAR